ncbi:MAG: NAD(P)H-hydrate epimerase [Trueperaceae bacterium]|nr:MAG: NAD(P)H-hydrate epimerase [Trueperaceae bacterium]
MEAAIINTEHTNIPTIAWSALPKVSAAQMQQMLMLATGKYRLDNRVIVEHIGRNLVELVSLFVPEGPLLVVAGRGNNGSGGLAAARLLASRGRRVWVVPTHEADNYSGTPKEQLEHLKYYDNVRVRSSLPKMKFTCVIDAAIGTNLDGPPRGRTQDVITVVNGLSEGSCIISLDTPTGLHVDDGSVPGDLVKATMTLAVGLPKQGVKPGGAVGELFLGDIGLPPALYEDLGLGSVRHPAFLMHIT